MSTKINSIRENYSMLLATFKDAGIKLTESQKSNIDQFILALENKIDETKHKTIFATKKVVENKLESEYKQVVESIIQNLAKNAELAGKIQDKITSINESKKMAVKVDEYLDKYLGEILPEQQIVDYSKMHKMEKDVESLKTQLTESKQIQRSLQAQVDKNKTAEFIESKVKDLPLFEARQIKKRLAGSTLEEVKKNFKKILESVQKDMELKEKADSICLEQEISDIIECDKTDDFDKTKKVSKVSEEIEEPKETDEVIPETEELPDSDEDTSTTEDDNEEVFNSEDSEDISDDTYDVEDEDEEISMKSEDDIYDSEASKVLSESEKINSNMMKYWISTASAINKNL